MTILPRPVTRLLGLLVAAGVLGCPLAGAQIDDTGWIELTSDNFVVVTDTNEEKGLRILEDLEARHALYSDTVRTLEPRPFPVRVFLFDNIVEFEGYVPESVKTGLSLDNETYPERSGYLFDGVTRHYMALRDRSVDELSDHVGHRLGHLFLARSALWQPFWLQEGVGEYVRRMGNDDGLDAVDSDEAYTMDALLQIVPSSSFSDLGDGGPFRRQAYHLFRILLDEYPDVLSAYLDELGRPEGWEAELDLSPAALDRIHQQVLNYDDAGFDELNRSGAAPTIRALTPGDANAALGDLAAAAGLGNLARRHYQESRSDDARLGLALLGRPEEQTANSRRGFQQLASELPDSGLVNYYFGVLDAATSQERAIQMIALQRATALLPQFGRAWSALAAITLEEGRPGEARDLARRAVEVEPEFADRAFEVIMNAELALGNTDAATDAAQTAATLPHRDPDSVDRYSQLVPELYRTLERMRREADADRLAEIRSEVEAIAAERDPRPEPVRGGALPVGLVHYDSQSDPPDGVSEPRLVFGDLPEYTGDLRRDRLSGEVVLEIDLDRQGRVAATSVVESDADRLSEAAILAVRRWRFDPARRDDESIPFSFRLTFTFDLQE